ncbi:unnamed protein product [Adineta ricciae]|uniref:F-box domain-containing protein n=1 Tax=Adineta ricciae TaxID=249248 RepID=A0A813MNQ8_ADIRI|nr:unnamed protein product [Adineta ricciae]CAF1226180.1 unnamed protein product [Adineta ricciae]
MQRMNFESMPDEIFLEIFDYVSGCDLIYSFYNLNQRFNSIIYGIRLFLDLSSVQQKAFLYTCHNILPNFSSQIYSMKLSNKQTIDGINYYIEQSKCLQQEQVKVLVLIEPTIEQFIKLISYFPSIKTLVVKTTDYLVLPVEYLAKSLRVCRIGNCQIDLSALNQSDSSSYSIEDLHVKMSDIKHLFTLLNSMIYLRRLTCHISENSSSQNTILRSDKPLMFLNYLKLNVSSVAFKYIENLLDVCPNLTALTYTYATGTEPSHDNENTDYDRWNEIFTKKLLRLKTFDLHISLNIDQQRDLIFLTKKFQDLTFFQQNHIRIIYEITSYKHIICTIPLIKSHLTNYLNKSSLTNIPNAYSRIRHFDLVLNETILNQQQHTIRCPLVHSFYLGLYENIAPIEQQSRLLLNQSISFVYLKHFELYGTCIADGFVAQLLSKMTNLNSLTLPLSHLMSCQINETICQNMKRIKRLQLALTESLSFDCINNILIPSFPNLNSMSFAIDNKNHSFEKILLTMLGKCDNEKNYLKYLMFLEIFALDQDWNPNLLKSLEEFIRYKDNYRFLYIWL